MVDPKHVSQSRNHMATTFTLVVSCAPERVSVADRVLTQVHAEIARLESELSEFRAASPVHRLNQAPPGRRVRLTRDGIELLKRSERHRQGTQGAFDCAAKSVSRPLEGPAVAWDARTLEAWRLAEGVRIGFGAIGKGYALDRARALLEQQGFVDYLLAAGGSSIVASGLAGPGRPWRLGWSWQKDAAGDALGIGLEHTRPRAIAIGVSGTQEKGEHIVRSSHGDQPASALVACASAADADALSTALFASGFDRTARLSADHLEPPALAVIDRDGRPTWNRAFNHLFGSLSALAAITTLAHAEEPAPAEPPAAEESIDLSGMGADAFAPYVTERQPAWIAAPLLALAIVLVHLRKNRRPSVKAAEKTATPLIATALLWATLEQAHAVDLVPMGKALIGSLGTPKASKKVVGDVDFFYSKDAKGKAEKVAAVIHNTWQKSCTHTWIVSLDREGKVTQVTAQEQQCPHAKPAAAESFLEQYKGKGPADVGKLKGEVDTIAKATGSCELATDAVVKAVTSFQKIKGQI